MLSMVGYMGILDLGIGPALLRYVAVEHSKNDHAKLQEVISSAQIFSIIIGTFAAIILFCISYFPDILVDSNKINSKYLSLIVSVFALNTGLIFPMTVYTAIIMGLQCHYFCNFTRIIITILKAASAYYLLLRFPGKGLLLLIMLELILNFIQLITYNIILKRDRSIPAFALSSCSRAKMKELFKYGAKSSILMIASRIQSASLPFVITTMLGVSSIVYFTIPNRLIDYAKGLSLAIGFPLTPYFASQMTNNDPEKVRISWLQTSLALQIVTTAMPLFMLFCGERFLSIWIGKEYGLGGRGVLYCLSVALFIEAIAPNASRILMASGHHGRAALMWLVLAVLSVPLAVLGASKWGVTGVAVGSSAAIIVGNAIMLRMACRDVGVTFAEYLQRTFMRLVVPLLLLTLFLWSSGMVLISENYLNLVLQVCFSGFLYLVAVWFLTLNADVRTRIFIQILQWFKKPDASLT